MQPSVISGKNMKPDEHKEEGSKILWLFAISVAALGVAVMASIFIESKEEMKTKAGPEKVQQFMRPTSQQPAENIYERRTQANEPPAYRREIRRISGQSKEVCLQQSDGIFDNRYVKCREGYTKEVYIRIK